MSSGYERAPLLPIHTASQRNNNGSSRAPSLTRWSLLRAALMAFVVLSIATSFALVHMSSLSRELLAHLQQLHAPPSLRSQASSPAMSHLSTHFSTASEANARVLIVYSNGTHLSQLAAAVERGVLQSVAHPDQLRTQLVEDASFKDDVLWADAVILGSHVVNANVEPKMTAFMSKWDFSQDLSHKVGAVFVTGGGLSAGEELTMVNLLHSMLIFRMIIVGGERWTSAFGASAIVSEGPFQPQVQVDSNDHSFPSECHPTSPDEIHAMFKDKAEGLGRRVALIASVMTSPRAV